MGFFFPSTLTLRLIIPGAKVGIRREKEIPVLIVRREPNDEKSTIYGMDKGEKTEAMFFPENMACGTQYKQGRDVNISMEGNYQLQHRWAVQGILRTYV